jgi:hypothetical protein
LRPAAEVIAGFGLSHSIWILGEVRAPSYSDPQMRDLCLRGLF